MTTEPEAIPADVRRRARMAVFEFETRVQSGALSNPYGTDASDALVATIETVILADRASRAPVDGADVEPVVWRWKADPFRWEIVHGFDPSLNLDDEHLSSLQPLYTHPALASPDAEMDGVSLIAAERRRQIEEEGFTAEHDDAEYHDGELHRAAAAYVLSGMKVYRIPIGLARRMKGVISAIWPWGDEWFKARSSVEGQNSVVRTLVKAGALIAAEIDQRQRRALLSKHGGNR